MEELKQEIVAILTKYIGEAESANMISVLSDRAILAFEEYVNYPSSWDESSIIADMTKHVSCISDVALYNYIQQGAEFQSMHIESGLYRMWTSIGSVYTYHNVVPFATTR